MKTRIAAAMAAFAVLAMTPAVSAAPAKEAERHCAVQVVGKEASGELIVDDLGCYSTPAARNAAAERQLTAAKTASDGAVVAMSTVMLAIHYDYSNYTGSSFTVYGADCSGGYIDLTGNWWDNRISSTIGNCTRVSHVENADGSGAVGDTFPTGPLGVMSNRASRVEYHDS